MCVWQVRDVITSVSYDVRNNPIISTGSRLNKMPRVKPAITVSLHDFLVVKSDDELHTPFWLCKVMEFTETTIKVRWYTGSGESVQHYTYYPAVHCQDDDPSKLLVNHMGN